MIVSVQPIFFCSQGCPYCYLGRKRKQKEILSIENMDRALNNLLNHNLDIEHIDIYGGNIDILDKEYLKDLIFRCYSYTKSVSIVTNLTNNNILDLKKNYFPDLQIAISWNKERPNHRKIENFLNKKQKIDNFNLLIVVLPSILQMNTKELLDKLEDWNVPVNFLRYFPSIYNETNYNISNEDFIIFIKKIILEYYKGKYSFPLLNIDLLNQRMNPLMTSNISITPTGGYSWISYNNDREIYNENQYLNIWKRDCYEELEKYNLYCNLCKYKDGCLAEHLNFNLQKNHQECNGLPSLLEWWDEKNLYTNN